MESGSEDKVHVAHTCLGEYHLLTWYLIDRVVAFVIKDLGFGLGSLRLIM